MAGKVGYDPVALEKHLDRYINDNYNNLVMEVTNKNGVYSLIITNIDTGHTAVSIQHVNGEYDVNGYHAADNKEAAERIESILSGNTLLAQTADIVSQEEIAEAERQMEEVRKQYEGTEQWLKAPNGKPSNLNERQWLQVRTPNFKAWFGDWENDPKNASKVVDENGEPMLMIS